MRLTPYIYWGARKTRLLVTDAQIDAQNAPFDLQLVTSKPLEALIQQCREVSIVRTMIPPSGNIFAKISSHTLKRRAFIIHYFVVSAETARWRLAFFAYTVIFRHGFCSTLATAIQHSDLQLLGQSKPR